MAMNERIKEFAKQAGFYKYGDDFEDIIEKFAELIGRECLTLADSIRDDCHADGSSEQALGAAWVGLAIARHFGFEE
jgi:hypothetical protein